MPVLLPLQQGKRHFEAVVSLPGGRCGDVGGVRRQWLGKLVSLAGSSVTCWGVQSTDAATVPQRESLARLGKRVSVKGIGLSCLYGITPSFGTAWILLYLYYCRRLYESVVPPKVLTVFARDLIFYASIGGEGCVPSRAIIHRDLYDSVREWVHIPGQVGLLSVRTSRRWTIVVAGGCFWICFMIFFLFSRWLRPALLLQGGLLIVDVLFLGGGDSIDAVALLPWTHPIRGVHLFV